MKKEKVIDFIVGLCIGMAAVIVVFLFMGCKGKPENNGVGTIRKLEEVKKKLDAAIVLQEKTKNNFDSLTKTVSVLLFQYYKAGWMDASNGCIDLHNRERFTDYNLSKLRFSDWCKMENLLNSKMDGNPP